jgi:hypothetical protein
MTSNFAKILEKAIKSRFIQFLEKNNILFKNQFGFKPKLGTENALYNTTSFIYNAFDNSKKATGIFLNLAKTFDTVDHAELIKLLPNFDIKNSSLKWFKCYLDKRKQKVKINGILGDEMLITCGVPQGSVLGPTLFILYINGISDFDINGQIITYADDICLLFFGDIWDNVRTKATLGFKKVLGYLNQRKHSINYKKQILLIFLFRVKRHA